MKNRPYIFHFIFTLAVYLSFIIYFIVNRRLRLDAYDGALVMLNTLLTAGMIIFVVEFALRPLNKFGAYKRWQVLRALLYSLSDFVLMLHFLLAHTINMGLSSNYIIDVLSSSHVLKGSGLSLSFLLSFCLIIPVFFMIHYRLEIMRPMRMASTRTLRYRLIMLLFFVLVFFRGHRVETRLRDLSLDQGRQIGHVLINPFFFIYNKPYFTPLKVTAVTFPETLASAPVDKNILMIVSESLRADVFQRDNFPQFFRALDKLQCVHYPRAYAAGHETSYSIFGLLYGIPSFFYHPYDNQHLDSYFLQALKNKNYHLSAYVASNLEDWMNGKFLVGGFHEHHDFSAINDFTRDEKMVQAFLTRPDRGPNFNFVFLGNTHFPYYYAPQYQKHTPVIEDNLALEDLMDRREMFEGIRNRYKNALIHHDQLLADLLQRLPEKDKNGLIVFTGDHGEYLGEQGLIGHLSSHFDEELIHVPLVICRLKNQLSDEIASHLDIFPALFAELGLAPGRGRDEFKIVTGVGTPYRNDLMLFLDKDYKYIFKLEGRELSNARLLQVKNYSDQVQDMRSHQLRFDGYWQVFRARLKAALVP